MTAFQLYALLGIALVAVGLDGLIRYVHLMRRILALNVISSGVFLVIAALGERGAGGGPDPVPQALVITGIVVAVAATGLALALMQRVAEVTGRAELPGPRSD